jgi:cytochrome c biogenesis protein CcmG/thiol:disulfide interchange protein DsbE
MVEMMMFKLTRFLLPLILFTLLFLLFWRSLGHDPHSLPSVLIGKTIPDFQLPALDPKDAKVTSSSLRGHITLLNVWASWCSACRLEHSSLQRLHGLPHLQLIGLNYKDERIAATEWLKRLGNPYDQVAWDPNGQLAIEFGVYGTPETFVIDATGVIRYRHVGPIDEQALHDNILPLIAELRSEKRSE